MNDLPAASTSSQLKFHAKGAEFFGIFWINTLLTIITLGFYYPWAKVRTTRYLYGSTELNNSRFEYHATAKQIFKGFVVVYGGFILFFILSTVAPPASGLLILLITLAVPVLLLQSLRFKAFMTSYRGIRFDFDLTVGKAYLAALIAGVIVFFTAGLAMPWVIWRFKHLIVNKLKFGNQQFECKGTFWKLAKVYTLCSLFYLVPVILIFFFMGSVDFSGGEEAELTNLQLMIISAIAIGSFLGYLVLFLIVVPLIQVTTINNLWGNTTIGGNAVYCKIPLGAAVWVLFTNGFLTFFTLGLYYPFAIIRWWRLRFDSMSIAIPEDFEQVIASDRQKQGAFGESAADALDVGFAL